MSQIQGNSPQNRVLQLNRTGQESRPARPASNSISISETQTDLYSSLVLLSVISKYAGPPKERDTSKEIGNERVRLRRDFLDRIAYLCDIDKSGKTVTAAALQKVPAFSILWLAANEGVRADVREFVRRVVDRIRDVTQESRLEIEKALLVEAVGIALPRLKFYREMLVKAAVDCRSHLKEYPLDERALNLRSWLRRLKKLGMKQFGTRRVELTLSLVRMCSEESGAHTSYIRERAALLPSENGNKNIYEDLLHYIGRMRAHVHAVKDIVEAGLLHPDLRNIGDIKYEDCPAIKAVSLPRECLNPFRVFMQCLGRIQNPMGLGNLPQVFLKRDREVSFESLFKAHPQMSDAGKIVTRVHSEVLLADLFSRRNFKFVEDDKYIGCSKPACYCCAQYFDSHRKNFVRPATHNKVLLGWRCPEPNQALDNRGMGKKIIGEVEEGILWRIREDIMQKIGDESGEQIEFQHLSTNGSTRAASTATGRALPLRGPP